MPPYAPYRSWRTLLIKLHHRRPLPRPFDPSFWNSLGFSGALLAVLKPSMISLGLMSKDNNATASLEELLNALGHEEAPILNRLLDFTYPNYEQMFDLDRVTSSQLSRYFDELGAAGETNPKCRSFFVGLARDAGKNLSPHLKIRASRPSSESERTQRGRQAAGNGPPQTRRRRQQLHPPAGATQTSLRLDSGGTVTVTLALNPLELSDLDQHLVSELRRLFQEYKSTQEASTPYGAAGGSGEHAADDDESAGPPD